ncbi:MAG: hypothetical protein JF602_07275, partial [Gemmatimonadetes bacterium]|nr:hypothetical protein [Gemmatimonadota bacterium]
QIAPVFEGGSQGKPVAVTQFLQSPKVETVTVEKVGLTIGSGGHAVIAGPSYIAEVREEMSVPVLSRVPYLSRMFRTVAYTKTNMRTVLIVSPKVIEAN